MRNPIWDDPMWEDFSQQEADPTPAAQEEASATPVSRPLADEHTGGVNTEDDSVARETPATALSLTREDIDNADFLEFEFGANVRFDHPTRHWYVWHKGAHRWKEDENGQVELMAQGAAKRRVKLFMDRMDAQSMKIAMALFARGKREAALADLAVRHGIGIGQNFWDRNPDVLCVRNGVLELPTGAFRPGEQLDHITKQAPVVYDPLAVCPRWMRFLSEVFVTPELIEYVRLMVGYCLTGRTDEQAWFLLYGTGANGKSVFANVLRDLFGNKEYHEQAAAETFTLTRYGPSPGHNIAHFRSARIVVASEVPDKASFDGARIKQLTGSDPVTAAAKYENNVTFIPQLKLLMLVNHLPSTRDDSQGFWRRLRPIPFDVTFEESQQDPSLSDTLRGELSGILNWALFGALEWYRSGLAALPASAAQLRDEYRAESDPLAMFVHECVLVTNKLTDTVQARELYRIYTAWSGQNHKPVMNETNFGRSPTIGRLGFGKKKTNAGAVYSGFKVYEPGQHVVKMPVRDE